MILRILMIIFLLLPGGFLTAQENQKKEYGFDFTMDLVSRYLWRGYDLNHKYGAMQSGLTYTPAYLPGLSASVWSSLGLAEKQSLGDSESSFDEVDLSLSYDRDIIRKRWLVNVTLQRYHFVSDWASYNKTNKRDYEISVTNTFAIHQFFSPYIQYAHGFDVGMKGDYYEIGAGMVYAFNKDFNIGPTLAFAISDQYNQNNEITHMQVLIPANYTIKPIALRPAINFVYRFKDLGNRYNRSGFLVALGVGVAYRF